MTNDAELIARLRDESASREGWPDTLLDEAADRIEALTRTLPQSLMIPNAISAIKRQVDDRERDKLEGHLAGTYISLSPEQAKEIVQFFEYRGAHEGTAAMRRALRSARGWLNVIAQDRPDGSDIHRVLDDVDAALAAIAHTQQSIRG